MRKLRTRQHVIADLGENYAEKQVLLAGFTFVSDRCDYGYDGYVHTFNEIGEVEPGEIYLQVKSTDKIKFNPIQNGFAFDLSIRDLEFWLLNLMPVVFVLYDAHADEAYYVELQEYFEKRPTALSEVKKFLRIFIPRANTFEPQIIQNLRTVKNQRYGIGFNL